MPAVSCDFALEVEVRNSLRIIGKVHNAERNVVGPNILLTLPHFGFQYANINCGEVIRSAHALSLKSKERYRFEL